MGSNFGGLLFLDPLGGSGCGSSHHCSFQANLPVSGSALIELKPPEAQAQSLTAPILGSSPTLGVSLERLQGIYRGDIGMYRVCWGFPIYGNYHFL